MIRRLRRRHLWMVAAVAVVAVALAVAALLLRPAPPLAPSLPPAVASAPGEATPGAVALRARGEVEARLRISRSGRRLLVDAVAEIGRPEVLLYWTPGATAGPDLPDGAALLGSLRGGGAQAFELSEEQAAGGELVFYSLGHREVVARAGLDPRPATAEGGS